jgi:hypothetical protein
LKGLTQVAVDCAGQVVDLGAFSALQGVFAVAAGLVAAVFETAFLGASIVVGGLSGPDATISTSKPTLTHECDTTGMAKAASSLFANYSGGQEAGYIYRVSCQGPYAAAFAGVEQTVGQHIDLDQLLFAEHNGTWTIASETNIVQEPADGVAIGMSAGTAQALIASLPTAPLIQPSIPVPVLTSAALSAAKEQWQQGVCVDAANQGGSWLGAASTLKMAAVNPSGDAAGFTQAAAQLTDLAAIPDTNVTPAQDDQYMSDVQALDAFFGTPGLYITDWGNCTSITN